MAAQETNAALAGRKEIVALSNFVSRTLGNDFMSHVTSHMADIITSAFTHVQDDKAMGEVFGQGVGKSVGRIAPPVLSAAMPKAVVETMDSLYEQPAFICLAETKPYVLTGMVVALTAGIGGVSPDSKLQCLFSIHLWLETFFDRKSEKILEVLPFLVQYLSLTLLNFIKKQRSNALLVRSALVVLQKLLVQTLPLAANSLDGCLLQINSGLIAVITGQEGEMECAALARQILELVFVDHGEKFQNQLELMEDYPENDPGFVRLRKVIKEMQFSRGLGPFIRKFLHITDVLNLTDCANLLRLAKSKLESMPGRDLNVLKMIGVILLLNLVVCMTFF
jgi:hypothetical protein